MTDPQAITSVGRVEDVVYPLRHFELFEEIGRGGMGVVYKARQRNAGNREVAVKTLLTDRATHDRFVRWFLREVRATLNFNHPNVVMAIEADEFENMPYLAMEFVDGPSLVDVLDARRTLPVPVACHLFTQLARGLRHAHQQGFLHRDVKPSNILLREDGIAKLCDFGVAGFHQQHTRPSEFQNTTTCVMGTPGYIAPEQASGEKSLTPQVDLFSLGASLHHALFGWAPKQDAISGFVFGEKDLPPSLAELGRALLETDPANRPRSSDEIIAEFKKHAQEGSFSDLVKTCSVTAQGRSITLTDLPPLPKSKVSRKVFLGILGGTFAVPAAVFGVARLIGGKDKRHSAGSIPFENLSAEQIEPHRKYPLFGKEPELWWGNAADPHLLYTPDSKARTLTVNSKVQALVRCSPIPFPNFNFEVTVIQKEVLGGIGFFFYGGEDGEGISLETIEISKVTQESVNLIHSKILIFDSTPISKRKTTLIMDLPKPISVASGEFLLKIESRYGRLHRSFLNGVLALEHWKKKTAKPNESADGFGILIDGEAATLKDAYISVW